MGAVLGLLSIRSPFQGWITTILQAVANASLQMVHHICLNWERMRLRLPILMVSKPAMALVWMAKVCWPGAQKNNLTRDILLFLLIMSSKANSINQQLMSSVITKQAVSSLTPLRSGHSLLWALTASAALCASHPTCQKHPFLFRTEGEDDKMSVVEPHLRSLRSQHNYPRSLWPAKKPSPLLTVRAVPHMLPSTRLGSMPKTLFPWCPLRQLSLKTTTIKHYLHSPALSPFLFFQQTPHLQKEKACLLFISCVPSPSLKPPVRSSDELIDMLGTHRHSIKGAEWMSEW